MTDGVVALSARMETSTHAQTGLMYYALRRQGPTLNTVHMSRNTVLKENVLRDF